MGFSSLACICWYYREAMPIRSANVRKLLQRDQRYNPCCPSSYDLTHCSHVIAHLYYANYSAHLDGFPCISLLTNLIDAWFTSLIITDRSIPAIILSSCFIVYVTASNPSSRKLLIDEHMKWPIISISFGTTILRIHAVTGTRAFNCQTSRSFDFDDSHLISRLY